MFLGLPIPIGLPENNRETNMEKPNLPKEGPVKTWFIKRTGDGHIFACDERQAHITLNDRSNWRRRDFELIGVSDGTTYFNMILKQANIKNDLVNEITELKGQLRRYMQTEERLKFDELLDDDNEKVIKVRSIMKEVNDKLDVLEDDLMNIEKTIINKAFNAELDVARGNIEAPRNPDVMTPGADMVQRNKIIANLPV